MNIVCGLIVWVGTLGAEPMRIRRAICFAAMLLVSDAAIAQSIPPIVTIVPTAPVVSIGVGESDEVAPDIAYLSLSMLARNKDRKLAMAENRRAVDAVLAALKAKGVAAKDIETTGYNVGENVDYSSGRRRTNGYVASTSITVTVRNLEVLSELVTAASDAGVTGIETPRFDVENKGPIIERLTRAATERARSRAEFHAKLNGYSGVRLVAVSDEVDSRDAPERMYAMSAPAYAAAAASDAAEDTGPSLTPQDVTIGVKLNFAFEMVK